LYVLEWGTEFGGGNPDAKLVRVEFVGNRPSLNGDYNRNGSVDAADYVVWRKTVGTTADLSADGNGDRVIDATDHSYWRAKFGASQEAPEPAQAAAAAMPGALAIQLGEPAKAAPTQNAFAEPEGIVAASDASPSRQPSSARPRAQLERFRASRFDGDDLLLLAADRALRLSPRESVDRSPKGENVDQLKYADEEMTLNDLFAGLIAEWD
jgi:hypothetical protein